LLRRERKNSLVVIPEENNENTNKPQMKRSVSLHNYKDFLPTSSYSTPAVSSYSIPATKYFTTFELNSNSLRIPVSVNNFLVAQNKVKVKVKVKEKRKVKKNNSHDNNTTEVTSDYNSDDGANETCQKKTREKQNTGSKNVLSNQIGNKSNDDGLKNKSKTELIDIILYLQQQLLKKEDEKRKTKKRNKVSVKNLVEAFQDKDKTHD